MIELNRLTIENCEFSFKCPKKWSELLSIEKTTTVKFCSACERPVFLCETDEDLRNRVAKGDCVCVIKAGAVVDRPGQSTLGNISTTYDPSAE